jgi:hypothetical protein
MHLGSQIRKAEVEAAEIAWDTQGLEAPGAGLKRARYNKAVRFLRSRGVFFRPIKWVNGFDGPGWHFVSDHGWRWKFV